MPDIRLMTGYGEAKTYEGVKKIKVPNADSFGYIEFTPEVLQNKEVSIFQNGTTTISCDDDFIEYTGLSSVTVHTNVSTPQPILQAKTITATENGTQVVTPDNGYDGLSSVKVTTNVEGSSGGGNASYMEFPMTNGSVSVSTTILQALMTHGSFMVDSIGGVLIDATAMNMGVVRIHISYYEQDNYVYTFTLGGIDGSHEITGVVTMTCTLGSTTATFDITYVEMEGNDVTSMILQLPIKLFFIQLPIAEG